MPKFYKKDKLFSKALFYCVITILMASVYIIQLSSLDSSNLLFLISYLMIIFIVSELVTYVAGIYMAMFVLALQLFQNNYYISFLLVLTVIYYYLVKLLRSKRMELLNQKEKHFRSLTNFTPQPIILKDDKGNILFASESINDLLGLKKSLPTGSTLKDYLHTDDLASYENHFKQLVENPYKKYSIELRMKKNNGNWMWIKTDSINLLKHENIKAIVSTIQDITFQKELDREKLEIIKEEKEARSLAEKAVKDRDEFLSIASHELKTPLTTILLQLQTNLRRISTQSLADFSGSDLLNSLQIAEQQSQRLSTLIKDLLNVSMASTGRITINPETVNLAELIRSIVNRYSEEIKLSGSRVQTILPEQEIVGKWDPVRLEQAIINLFTNALKYGGGNKITISVYRKDALAYVKIKDRGEGISQKMQKEIFKPFKRVNNNSKVLGLGVGLFIAKQIVLSHGGEINVESKPNKGSTFVITLPL